MVVLPCMTAGAAGPLLCILAHTVKKVHTFTVHLAVCGLGADSKDSTATCEI